MSRGEANAEARGAGRAVRVGFLLLASLLALGLVGGCLALRMASPGKPARPIADVSSSRILSLGPVVGFAADAETHAWLGLPFAQPPVGALRWRAPRAPAAWAETRDALEFGRPCVQAASATAGGVPEEEDGLAGEEDCLYLNVWAPRSEPDEVPTGRDRLPVMVWVHGGGNTSGWPGEPLYDGARLAGRERVIVVSVAYRLGLLGWLSHPALRAEASDPFEASGNFGTLDQIAALRWVQANIEEFGGDPGNVTVFGESAGGTNVFALLLSPEARGLFHRALAQSGSTRAYSRAEAEAPSGTAAAGRVFSSADFAARLFVAAGVVPDAAAARDYAASLPAPDLLQFLRARSAREILDATREGARAHGLRLAKPIRDGVLLPEVDWLEALADGAAHDVPVLAGATRDEWKLFMALDPDHVDRRFGLFFRMRDPEDYERRARALSDRRIVQGVNAPLSALRRAGRSSLFAYRFDFDALPSVLGQDLGDLLGAGHGLELPLLFGTYDVGNPLFSRVLYREEDRPSQNVLADQMRSYWAAFARDGRPGRGRSGSLPAWGTWAPGGRWMILDDEASGGPRMAATSLDPASIAARIESDTSISLDARCALYADVFDDSSGWRNLGAELQLAPAGCVPSASQR